MNNYIITRSFVLPNGYSRITRMSPACTLAHAQSFLDTVAGNLERQGYGVKAEEDGFTALLATGRGIRYTICCA